MSRSQSHEFRFRYALGLSTLLHLAIAPLFAISGVILLGAGQSRDLSGLHANERTTIATVTIHPRVTLQPRTHQPNRSPSNRHTELATRQRLTANAPARDPARKPSQASRAVVRGGGNSPVARITIATRPVAAPNPAAIVAVADPSPTPNVQPPPQIAATPAAVILAAAPLSSMRGQDGSVGGWGQNFERPLIADENAFNQLRAKYHFAVTIIISVDENGRAVAINIPDNVPSEARGEIERRLGALRYIPAECNGLRCPAPLSVVI